MSTPRSSEPIWMLMSRPRFCGVAMSATYAIAPVMNIADPAPARTRQAISSSIPPANPLPKLPAAVIARPDDISTVRP